MRLMLLIMLFLSFSAFAQDGWYKDGKVIEDSLWQSHDGPFKARLFLTDAAESIYKQWNEGPANQVRITNLQKVKAGKQLKPF